jgi:hypothetical protein
VSAGIADLGPRRSSNAWHLDPSDWVPTPRDRHGLGAWSLPTHPVQGRRSRRLWTRCGASPLADNVPVNFDVVGDMLVGFGPVWGKAGG